MSLQDFLSNFMKLQKRGIFRTTEWCLVAKWSLGLIHTWSFSSLYLNDHFSQTLQIILSTALGNSLPKNVILLNDHNNRWLQTASALCLCCWSSWRALHLISNKQEPGGWWSLLGTGLWLVKITKLDVYAKLYKGMQRDE